MMLMKMPATGVKAASVRRNGMALPARGVLVMRKYRENEGEGDKLQSVAQNLKGTASPADKPRLDITQIPVQEAGNYTAPKLNDYSAPGTWLTPSFTRKREVYAGRLAMVGIAAAMAWEISLPSHPGPIATTSLLTAWSTTAVEGVFVAIALHGVAGFAWPGSPTFSRANQQDVARRPMGPPAKPVSLYHHPATFFGISREWGFTKKNELFTGRMAMLGFLALLLGEARMGTGLIGQVSQYLGSIPTEATYAAAANLFIGWTVFNIGLSWILGNMGEVIGDEEVY